MVLYCEGNNNLPALKLKTDFVIYFPSFENAESNNYNLVLTYSEVSELLRYSICGILDLKSKGYSKKIEEFSKLVQNNISGIVLDCIPLSSSEDVRMGFLEACVHSMELSRERVGL